MQSLVHLSNDSSDIAKCHKVELLELLHVLLPGKKRQQSWDLTSVTAKGHMGQYPSSHYPISQHRQEFSPALLEFHGQKTHYHGDVVSSRSAVMMSSDLFLPFCQLIPNMIVVSSDGL
ncbi:hypothetical protein HGM15179_012668 [Zosterops borbonicus]|uniref:Uncharacterized protein n=1 Tax=Zosterops borbonicus TaxID=364589 RepID=A0A8K1LHN8_9PASS|nr:hypothetical protein HGM15179_012668 [Zosterops borbonicus]